MAKFGGIPVGILSKLGRHEIEIHGVKVTAYSVDNHAVADKHITDLHTHLRSRTTSGANINQNFEVVGIDIRRFKSSTDNSEPVIIVLCSSTRCIILNMGDDFNLDEDHPKSFDKFVKDPESCLVGHDGVGVLVDELAARVFNQLGLIDSSLADIARQVGVPYEAASLVAEPTKDIKRETRKKPSLSKVSKPERVKPFLLTDQEVKVVMNDAFARCQIGHKLLSKVV